MSSEKGGGGGKTNRGGTLGARPEGNTMLVLVVTWEIVQELLDLVLVAILKDLASPADAVIKALRAVVDGGIKGLKGGDTHGA